MCIRDRVPEPRAMRLAREEFNNLGFSFSSGVIDWIITPHFSRRPSAVFNISSGTLEEDIPGIILRTLPKGPIFLTAWNCSYISCLLYTSDAADDLLCVD